MCHATATRLQLGLVLRLRSRQKLCAAHLCLELRPEALQQAEEDGCAQLQRRGYRRRAVLQQAEAQVLELVVVVVVLEVGVSRAIMKQGREGV